MALTLASIAVTGKMANWYPIACNSSLESTGVFPVSTILATTGKSNCLPIICISSLDSGDSINKISAPAFA